VNDTEILDRLHASEINGEVSWLYDIGFRWRLGDDINGWVLEGADATATAAIRALAEAAFTERPKSAFGKRQGRWWCRMCSELQPSATTVTRA
jgi:hypothetical protein